MYCSKSVFFYKQLQEDQAFKLSAELPPVSTALVTNLAPVSTTLAANFATSSAGVVDTGGKPWEQYQTGDNLK